MNSAYMSSPIRLETLRDFLVGTSHHPLNWHKWHSHSCASVCFTWIPVSCTAWQVTNFRSEDQCETDQMLRNFRISQGFFRKHPISSVRKKTSDFLQNWHFPSQSLFKTVSTQDLRSFLQEWSGRIFRSSCLAKWWVWVVWVRFIQLKVSWSTRLWALWYCSSLWHLCFFEIFLDYGEKH